MTAAYDGRFPEGATLEQTGPETWVLRLQGPSETELENTSAVTLPEQIVRYPDVD